MNALGVQVERARKRPIMSTFHALRSVGGFAGAATVLVTARLFHLDGGTIVASVLLFLATAAVLAFIVAVRITPPMALIEHNFAGARTKIPPVAWLLGIMAIGFGLPEGTATDWAALHVTEVAHVGSTTGALGLVVVSGFMMIIRLVGDRLVARFGRRAGARTSAAPAPQSATPPSPW